MISEINVDGLVEQKVVVNKKELIKDVDYTVKHSNNSNSGWNQYTYSINSSLFSNQVAFDMPLGYAQKAKITCTDMAGNSFTKVIDNITVSNDWYVLFYANKTLFYCTIAGVAVLALGITSFIVFKKKTK